MTSVLASTHHELDGRLFGQLACQLPTLRAISSRIAVYNTDSTHGRALDLFAAASVMVRRTPAIGDILLGWPRRGTVEFGMELDTPHMLFRDLDRMLHWVEFYSDELAQVVAMQPNDRRAR